MKLTEKQIDEISQELDCGMKCYINKETGEFKSVLDWDEMYGETELWEEELENIEKNWREYVVIEKMSSREAFEVMERFVEKVLEKRVRGRLIETLNGRRPFRNFKNEVDSNEEIRQEWFAHKAEEYKTYVRVNLGDEFELPKVKEEALVEKEDVINLNGKTLLLLKNSEKGEVDSETKFEYKQEGNLVTADYYGGTIKYGKIIGYLVNDELEMVYQCLTQTNKLRSGKGLAQLKMDKEGKIKMIVNWKWLDEKGNIGISEYIEE